MLMWRLCAAQERRHSHAHAVSASLSTTRVQSRKPEHGDEGE